MIFPLEGVKKSGSSPRILRVLGVASPYFLVFSERDLCCEKRQIALSEPDGGARNLMPFLRDSIVVGR